jgi:hypothetical protein
LLAILGSIVLAALSYPALSQTSPITPNGITYVGNTSTFAANQSSTVYVQISYNGQNLSSEGVRVYFQAKDPSVIPAELGTYALTDANGVANFTFTANSTGDTNLTATALGPNSGISATQAFHIVSAVIPAITPTPLPTITPTPSLSATSTPVPTAGPTMNPIFTASPSATSSTGDANSQAFGILAVGIVLAAIMIVAVFIARMLGKK